MGFRAQHPRIQTYYPDWKYYDWRESVIDMSGTTMTRCMRHKYGPLFVLSSHCITNVVHMQVKFQIDHLGRLRIFPPLTNPLSYSPRRFRTFIKNTESQRTRYSHAFWPRRAPSFVGFQCVSSYAPMANRDIINVLAPCT